MAAGGGADMDPWYRLFIVPGCNTARAACKTRPGTYDSSGHALSVRGSEAEMGTMDHYAALNLIVLVEDDLPIDYLVTCK